MKNILLAMFVTLFSSLTFANVVVVGTENWKSVPIKVDSSNNTYTVVGTVPTDTTDYYYSYSGYRCFRESRSDFVGINSTVFKAGVSGGSDIYCYPEQ